MGKRFFSLLLWGLVAFFLVQTCFPSDKNNRVSSIGAERDRVESFLEPSPGKYDLVLENEYIYSEWSARGASCGRVYLKKFDKNLGGGNFSEHGMLIYSSEWVQGKEPDLSSPYSQWYYRTRDAFRLVESSELIFPVNPESRVKKNFDSIDFNVEVSPKGLRFSYDFSNGIELIKDIVLEQGGYHFDTTITAIPRKKDVVGRDLELELFSGGGIYIEDDAFYPNPYIGVALTEYGELESVDFETPMGEQPSNRAVTRRWLDSNIPFVVEGSKYFVSIIAPFDNRGFEGAYYETLFDDLAASQAGEGKQVSIASPYWLRASVAGKFALHFSALDTSVSRKFRWYVGPKDPSYLNAEDYGSMGQVVDYADYERSFFFRIFFTSTVAPAILWLLEFFYSIVGNYGIAIILLTILVKAAVFPIMRSSQVKMAAYSAKMAVVKPQLDAVQKKYANDPQKKNQATMELYQKHRLSPPIGGCLPMFLQMPIFIGLFQALRSSILLRHEPFTAWIHDLSQPDALINFGGPIADFPFLSSVTSFNLLPIVMVVLWVLHQRSMPKPTDPQQAQVHKMMAIMPIIFGFVLYNYAAGLSLYMIMSSLIGIFEQKFIRKRWPIPSAGTSVTK